MDDMLLNSSSQSGNVAQFSETHLASGPDPNNSKHYYHTIQLSPPGRSVIPDGNQTSISGWKPQEAISNGVGHSNHFQSPPLVNNSSLIFFGESHPPSNYLSSSNNSPFQSAAEEPDQDEDGNLIVEHPNDDREPLIFRGPPCQSVFHQFLSSAKGVVKGSNGSWSERKLKLGELRLQQNYQPNLAISTQQLVEEEGTECRHSLGEDSEDEDQVFRNGRSRHRVKSPDRPSSSTGAQSGSRPTSCSIGILLAAVSCIFFATSALIVKVSRLHPMELLCVRGALQAVFISPIVLSSGNSFLGPSGARALLLSRAVLGSVSLIMSFASIHLIPLADAATCIFTSPVFVSLFACICLRELCSWFDVAMILLTLLGVVLVSQPSFHFLSIDSVSSEYSWTSILGTVCGLLAAMLTALAFIVLRQLKHVHYSVVVFWFSVVLAGFGGVLMVALDGFRLPSDVWDVVDCVGIGICGFLGQILLTKALQIENAGPCAVARTLDIVLAFFYQITLLHDTPDWTSYLGSFLVVSCVLLTAFRRWYREKYGLDEGRVLDNRNCSYARAHTGIS